VLISWSLGSYVKISLVCIGKSEIIECLCYNNRHDLASEIIHISKLRKAYKLRHMLGNQFTMAFMVKCMPATSTFAEEFENMTSLLLCGCLLDKKNKIPHSVACLA
jgi:hypothetical protein